MDRDLVLAALASDGCCVCDGVRIYHDSDADYPFSVLHDGDLWDFDTRDEAVDFFMGAM